MGGGRVERADSVLGLRGRLPVGQGGNLWDDLMGLKNQSRGVGGETWEFGDGPVVRGIHASGSVDGTNEL